MFPAIDTGEIACDGGDGTAPGVRIALQGGAWSLLLAQGVQQDRGSRG
jgi:hypothetical protein